MAQMTFVRLLPDANQEQIYRMKDGSHSIIGSALIQSNLWLNDPIFVIFYQFDILLLFLRIIGFQNF